MPCISEARLHIAPSFDIVHHDDRFAECGRRCCYKALSDGTSIPHVSQKLWAYSLLNGAHSSVFGLVSMRLIPLVAHRDRGAGQNQRGPLAPSD